MKSGWKWFYGIILVTGVCGICLTAANGVTGCFNSALSGGGTAVCLMGFAVAAVYSAKMLCQRSRRAKQVQK